MNTIHDDNATTWRATSMTHSKTAVAIVIGGG